MENLLKLQYFLQEDKGEDLAKVVADFVHA